MQTLADGSVAVGNAVTETEIGYIGRPPIVTRESDSAVTA
jgi:hypothetical protein